MRGKRWMVACAVTAALAVLSPVGDAAARRPKVVAKINGHRFKSNKHAVVGDLNSFILAVGGATIPHRIHGKVRGFGIVCQVDNLAAQPLPLPLTCGADYYEQVLGTGVHKQWDTATGIQVVVTSVGADRVGGTFEGTLEMVDPTHAEDGPATVEKGKFDVVVTLLGASTGDR
jgi:hypothetical protein